MDSGAALRFPVRKCIITQKNVYPMRTGPAPSVLEQRTGTANLKLRTGPDRGSDFSHLDQCVREPAEPCASTLSKSTVRYTEHRRYQPRCKSLLSLAVYLKRLQWIYKRLSFLRHPCKILNAISEAEFDGMNPQQSKSGLWVKYSSADKMSPRSSHTLVN